MPIGGVDLLLAAGALVAVVTTVPYVATAITYRRRDNGLAYLLFVLGVGIWNGMFAVQVLPAEPLVKGFYLGLEVVGALLAGLGWFLFASTASSTPSLPDERLAYGAVSVLVGIDIALAVTAPVNGLYWTVPEAAPTAGFAVVSARPGYWFHTGLLVALFLAGGLLFGAAWRAGISRTYTRAYAAGSLLAVVAIVASNVTSPGGGSLAPHAAAVLTTIGWVQASRGTALEWLRARA